jgi:hypothetical protein
MKNKGANKTSKALGRLAAAALYAQAVFSDFNRVLKIARGIPKSRASFLKAEEKINKSYHKQLAGFIKGKDPKNHLKGQVRKRHNLPGSR